MNENELVLPQILDGEDKSSFLTNRIRKNTQHLRKWAKRTHTDCFRIYDRDIKEYPVAIDFYAGRFCVYYFSFDADTQEPPAHLEDEVHNSLSTLFGAFKDTIYEKTRIRRKRTEQYEKRGEDKEFFVVREYGVKFLVNLADYLDTGLFLDHRETRRMVGSLAKGKRVLNLFAYTCSFSVHAAIGGAIYTKSVDLSNTYTAWGKENFLLNGLSTESNEVVREDCFRFLEDEVYNRVEYDLIIIDPPTISRSKKMGEMFDIQLDYPLLLNLALKLLSKEGTLFFSTNSRNFRFEGSQFANCSIQEITEKTIPIDFHNKKIHRCWKIQHQI